MSADWLVRVYENDSDAEPSDSWTIENRTENEAEREAAWSILANHPDADDWTMVRL